MGTTTVGDAPRDPGRRLLYVDSMRVYGVLLVLVIHVAEVFNPWDEWHISNAQRSGVVGEVVVLTAAWIMPLMMLLAGVSSWYSLRRRGNGDYLRERTVRLLLPLVVGTLLLVPPQVYLERRMRGEFAGSFVEFFPHFFDGVYPAGNLSWHHLWFLAHLYGYSILALPIFRYLQHARGSRALRAAARVSAGPAGLLWLALPLVVERSLLWGLFPERHVLTSDWSNHALLFVAYVYGFVLAGTPWLGTVIDAQWPRALVAAALGSATIMTGAWIGLLPTRLPPPYSLAYLAFWALYALVAWAWMVALLGFARRKLDHADWFVRRAQSRAYLWYVMHQPVVVAAAFVIVQWRLGVAGKVVALAVLSVAGTMLSSALVLRLPWLGVMFGAGTPTRAIATAPPRAMPAPRGGNLAGPREIAIMSEGRHAPPPATTGGRWRAHDGTD